MSVPKFANLVSKLALTSMVRSSKQIPSTFCYILRIKHVGLCFSHQDSPDQLLHQCSLCTLAFHFNCCRAVIDDGGICENVNAAVAEGSTSTRHGMATLAQTSAFAGDARTGGVRELLPRGLCRMLFRP